MYKIAGEPVLSNFIASPSTNDACPSVRKQGKSLVVPSGRIAIGLALKILNVKQGDEVLVPSYHCPSMIDPILWMGAKPIYYHINRDLSPNYEHIRLQINNNTKAVLLVSYFGFYQHPSVMLDICAENKIAVIEDCAHCYFLSKSVVDKGLLSRFIIASPRKFFPTTDGGMLVYGGRDKLEMTFSSLGFRYEIKMLYNAIERAIECGRLRWLGRITTLLGNRKENTLTPQSVSTEEQPLTSDYDDPRFSRDSLEFAGSFFSKISLAMVNESRCVTARKNNYNYYVEKFTHVDGVSLLREKLNTCDVPYMFPLLINNAEKYYGNLRDLGLPILRWENVNVTDCEISNAYSKNIVFFPCHQQLKTDELNHIVTTTLNMIANNSG